MSVPAKSFRLDHIAQMAQGENDVRPDASRRFIWKPIDSDLARSLVICQQMYNHMINAAIDAMFGHVVCEPPEESIEEFAAKVDELVKDVQDASQIL